MKALGNQVFSKADTVLETSLNHRLAKQQVTSANVVNASTPGYRAMGYEFESQLQSAIGTDGALKLKVSQGRHLKNPGISADGDIKPDLFVKPTESIGNDGNTVDIDQEMADMASNQIIYKTTVELLNRRLAMMRYGINGGR